MKKQIAILTLFITIFCLFDCLFTSLYWQHQAVLHHAAFFEADSWGRVSYHWNDESFAQVVLQDEGWQKIMDGIFQKKLKTLGLQ